VASYRRGTGHFERLNGGTFSVQRLVWSVAAPETEVHFHLEAGELDGLLYELVLKPVAAVSGSYQVYLYDPHDSDVLEGRASALGTGASGAIRRTLYQEITTVSGRVLRPLYVSSALPYRLRLVAEADKMGTLDLVLLPARMVWQG